MHVKLMITRGKEWTGLEIKIFTSWNGYIAYCYIILYFTLSLQAIISRNEGDSAFPISQTLMKQQISAS